MTYAAAVAAGGIALSYMQSQQRMAAQQSANQANIELSKEATAEQKRQFNLRTGALSQSRREREDEINRQMQERFTGIRQENIGRLDPYSQAGTQALSEQRALMGLSGEAEQEAAMGRFQESPGQKFLRERQEKSLLRSSAAIGGLGGGNVRTALQEQAYGRASTRLDDRLSRLQGLQGQGLAAGSGIAAMGAGPGYTQTGADVGVITPKDIEDNKKANAIAPSGKVVLSSLKNKPEGNAGGSYGSGGTDTGGY